VIPTLFPLHLFLENLAGAGFAINLRDYRRLSRVLSCDGEWSVLRLQRVLRSLLVCNEEQGLLFDQQFQQYFQTDLDVSDIIAPVDIQRWNNELTLLLATLKSNHSDVDQKYNHPYIAKAIEGEKGERWTLRRRFLRLSGGWHNSQLMQFSPHILVALRQSFAKRDKTWRD
jgi:hypothetical protein